MHFRKDFFGIQRFHLLLWLFLCCGCVMANPPKARNSVDNGNGGFVVIPSPDTNTDLYKDIKGLQVKDFFHYNITLLELLIYTTSDLGLYVDYYQSVSPLYYEDSLYGTVKYNIDSTQNELPNSLDFKGSFDKGFTLPNDIIRGKYIFPIPFRVDGKWDLYLDGKNFCLSTYDFETYQKITEDCDVFSVHSHGILDLTQVKNKDVLVYFILPDQHEYMILPPIHWRSPNTFRSFSISKNNNLKISPRRKTGEGVKDILSFIEKIQTLNIR